MATHRMRVLFIPGAYPPKFCGIGDTGFNIVEQLKENMDIRLYVPEGSIRNIGKVKVYNPESPHHLRELWNYLRNHPVEIIHLQYPTAIFTRYHLVLALLVIRIGFPKLQITTTIHEIQPYLNTTLARRIRFVGYFFRLFFLLMISNGLISTNRREYNWLKRFHSRVRIIPIGSILTEKIIRTIPETSLPVLPEHYAIFFGNIHASKRLDVIIQAWASIKALDYHLLICYGNQEVKLVNQLYQKIEQLGLKDRVFFYRGMDNRTATRMIFNSRGVILPYQGGITPRSMVLQTALACQKQILAEIGPETPFWLKKILPFHYSYPYQPHDIGRTITCLFETIPELPSQSRKMEIIRSYFSWRSIAEKYHRFYQEMIKELES